MVYFTLFSKGNDIGGESIYVNYSAAKMHPKTAIFVDTTGT